METVLKVDNIQKKFGKNIAVDGVSFEVHKGEIFGVLGPNGAGKSTILSIIAGLVKPDKGNIKIFGLELKQAQKKALKNFGILLENPGFYGHISAFDNIRLFGRFKESSPSEIHTFLEKVGLAEHKKKKVKEFSIGMRKRLGLVIAILGKPKLLILDEPTSSLDPKGAKSVLSLIKSLSAEEKTSVVISSNLLYDIEAVCDRVLLINKGQVVFCEPVKNLLKSRDNSYKARITPIEKALCILKNLTGVKSVERVDETYVQISLSGISSADMNKQLISMGLDVHELIPVKKTLQELFLELNH